MNDAINMAKRHLLSTQQKQTNYVDTQWRDVLFDVGLEANLSTSKTWIWRIPR